MRTVVILDDSDSARELVERSLGRRGWRVVALSSAFELPSTIAAEKPDLVLIDVEMPALRGDAVVGMLTKDRYDQLHRCPFVLYSALPERKLAMLAKMSGAAGFIRKDTVPAELAQRVEAFAATAR